MKDVVLQGSLGLCDVTVRVGCRPGRAQGPGEYCRAGWPPRPAAAQPARGSPAERVRQGGDPQISFCQAELELHGYDIRSLFRSSVCEALSCDFLLLTANRVLDIVENL